MKLLMAFTALQRARHSSTWLNVPPVRTVVLVAGNKRSQDQFSGRTFHASAARALLAHAAVDVVVMRAGEKLPRHADHGAACYAAGAMLMSHANRFAFPDALLGMGYDGRGPQEAPLASDGLALRGSVFPEVPAMRMKVLYVARKVGEIRGFNRKSEEAMRGMLREVTKEAGFELSVFEGMGSKNLFLEQIGYFSDASLIVGFHGAGLALATLAPRGAVLVEIKPEDHQMWLFGNLASSGLDYAMFKLSKGTREKVGYASVLLEGDLTRLRRLLLNHLLGKLRPTPA